MEHGGKRFPDAVEELARDAGLAVPRIERPGDAERRDQAQDLRRLDARRRQVLPRARSRTAPRAIDYLKRRGLTGAIAARFGIGYAPDGWQPLAAAFPDYDDVGARDRRPGDRRRRRQALRPLPRPDHVPDPRQRAAR